MDASRCRDSVPQDVEQPKHHKVGATPNTSSKPLILIADDNQINQKLFSRHLMRLGYNVEIAVDGQAACDYLDLSSGKPRPILVFMDVQMPVMDGCDATRRIRTDDKAFDAQTRAIPIVGLTGSVLTGVRDQCLEAGMNDLIGPPVRRSNFKEAIEKWAASDTRS